MAERSGKRGAWIVAGLALWVSIVVPVGVILLWKNREEPGRREPRGVASNDAGRRPTKATRSPARAARRHAPTDGGSRAFARPVVPIPATPPAPIPSLPEAVVTEPSPSAEPEAVTDPLERECEGGNAASCESWGEKLRWGRPPAFTRNPQAATKAYEKACQGDQGVACMKLAFMFQNGEMEKNEATAEEWFKKAFAVHDAQCKAGDPLACARLGEAYHRGYGVAPDEKRASELYQQAFAMPKPSPE